MTAYLLDTNIVSYLFDDSSSFNAGVVTRFATLAGGDRCEISVLGRYELEEWAALGTSPIDMGIIDATFTIRPVPAQGAKAYARLRRELIRRRTITRAAIDRHGVDLILAATALVDALVLVSNDRVFAEIAAIEPGLRLENWASGPG